MRLASGKRTSEQGRDFDMSYWRGRKVLITGAGGFIGSHLCDRLVAAGLDVLEVRPGRRALEDIFLEHTPSNDGERDVRTDAIRTAQAPGSEEEPDGAC